MLHPDISCELARIRIAERLDEARRERLAAMGRRPEPVPTLPARLPRRRRITQRGHAHGHT